MTRLHEIKEEKTVVKSVGSFADSLQKIAAGRMTKLRKVVEASRPFVEEASEILRELELERVKHAQKEMRLLEGGGRKKKGKKQQDQTPKKELNIAIIVVTSDQGLSGSYNSEIIKRAEQVIPHYKNADYFVIGTKGQDYFAKTAKKQNLSYYPYNIPEEVHFDDLRPLIGMFYHYDQIFIIYSKYINTITRQPVFVELTTPHLVDEEDAKEEVEGKFIFEPDIDDIIRSVSFKLRYALFKQQILNSKLSLYTSQMMAMKTATENAEELLKDLQLEYNKARRKQIDKKIQEVQAGRALWADEE